MSRKPTDWWTGEPEPGLYITPEGFLEDLAAVQGKSNITIKINSCGGDLYTGIAIHNALKGLNGQKTVIVEGVAASAASIIACAGDEVQVYPGSMVMIHGVSGFLRDYYTLSDLKKLQKDFDASERAVAEIYHAKTGLDVDKLRSMMSRETWMVGQEAVDNGFADTLLADDGPDMSLSADKKVLLVAGIRHDVAAFQRIPKTIPTNHTIQIAPADTKEPSIKEETNTMTIEEIKAQYPEIVSQISKAAAKEAVMKERERLQAIESIAVSVGDPDLLYDAKYGETPCTAEQLALRSMQKQADLGVRHLADSTADYQHSGAADIGALPADSQDDSKSQVDSIVNLYKSTKGGTK